MQKETTIRKVIILLFIAVTIVVVMVVGVSTIKRSQLAGCEKNINILKGALEEFYNENQSYPKGELQIEDLTFIRPPLPKDTATGKSYIYEVSKDGKDFKLSCPNPKNHGVKAIYATADLSTAVVEK